ncbi:MAG: efflux RND transporter periplasmic adaptor subunit [Pseudomonadota bacterium]|nr:efflux RND transporter periplasmic adaptor subunit [Pseudomonadota bacterium]
MTGARASFVIIGIVLLGGALYGMYELGLRHATGSNATATAAPQSTGGPQKPGDLDPATGKKVLYWHDPMVPGQKFDHPGKSPFMDMMLVPVYVDADTGTSGVGVDPRMQQSLGVRTAEVTRGSLGMSIDAAGSIAYNEREQAVIQARATGYVERLHVRATLDRVAAGAPLADLYVPDWVAAQEEFLTVRRWHARDMPELADAARARMRQAGMTEAQIRLVESSGQSRPRVTITAPMSGVVSEIAAREGMTVMPGTTLFRINGLSTVWANVEVPESQAALVLPGAQVEARSPALGETVLKGRVQAILPQVTATTRTMTARIELANTAGRLAPGMFVTVRFGSAAREALMVPSEAVIQTGKRTLVMLAQPDGKFSPVEVETGAETNGRTEIRSGLQAGQKVVTSGQFLIDSEASLRSFQTRSAENAPAPAQKTQEHTGIGKVEAVGARGVTLSHDPIPSMQWGAMTMEFALPSTDLARGVKPGDSVRFAFRVGADGQPTITRMERTESAGVKS